MNKPELNESWPILTGLTIVGLLIHCTCLGADKKNLVIRCRQRECSSLYTGEGSCKFMSYALRVNNKQIRRAVIEKEGFNTAAALRGHHLHPVLDTGKSRTSIPVLKCKLFLSLEGVEQQQQRGQRGCCCCLTLQG